MQAISTKYLGPTDTLGSRIKARTESGQTLTIPYPHELDPGLLVSPARHAKAAIALALKMGWDGELVSGATNTGYVFVFAAAQRYAIG